jgi:hypothetical protein
MIQRIQSLYLFIALILIAVCFFIPVATVSFPTGDIYTFNLSGFKILELKSTGIVYNSWSILITGLLICSLILVTVFSYKNRILQIRLCVYIMVFSIGLAFMLYWMLYQFKKAQSVDIIYHITIVFPIISAILSFLAIKSIRKDDNKVKSYDRLR